MVKFDCICCGDHFRKKGQAESLQNFKYLVKLKNRCVKSKYKYILLFNMQYIFIITMCSCIYSSYK